MIAVIAAVLLSSVQADGADGSVGSGALGGRFVRREDAGKIVGVAIDANAEVTPVRTDIVSGGSPSTGVPRIVHQTFRKKLTVGSYPNPVWERVAKSWRHFFPEGHGPEQYDYKLWTDSDILSFYAKHCEAEAGPLQLQHYNNKISISDLGRYCILWKEGGIYADLDYEPRANFFSRLASDRPSLVESPYKHEEFQNSLMASPPGHPYWIEVLRHARQRAEGPAGDANALSGPQLLEELPATHDRSVVAPLPCKEFQRATHPGDADPSKNCGVLDAKGASEVLGIHWGTLSWRMAGLTGSGRDRSADTARLFDIVSSAGAVGDVAA